MEHSKSFSGFIKFGLLKVNKFNCERGPKQK